MNLGPTKITVPGLWNYGRIDGLPISADVSSPFGPRTPISTPVGMTSDFHGGIDLPAPGGTPIICPVDELVVTAEGPAINGYGNCVFGSTSDGFQLLFAHMRSGAHAGLGQTLKRGDVVGLVGTTGASTGDHLHFGVIPPGAPKVEDVNLWIHPTLWADPMHLFVETLPAAEVLPEPPADNAAFFADFLQNSLRALANNPPPDMNAALVELAKRIEYLKGLLP